MRARTALVFAAAVVLWALSGSPLLGGLVVAYVVAWSALAIGAARGARGATVELGARAKLGLAIVALGAGA
ncbi:hypothetical protein L6R52_40855, partial [Myxococcota bacterium]|nr:hypothetical protein [Myxococcota bacterium]